MRRTRSFVVLAKLSVGIAFLLLLGGCAPGDSIFDENAPMVPPPILNNDQGIYPTPQYEETPRSYMEWNASEETREWHGAASRSDCDRLEKALKDQGLDINLAERQPTGDPNLPWACIFEGKDADPNAARFQDRRYENRDESEYP
jgi:hypothetical protein